MSYGTADVVIVSMPWAPPSEPSLAGAILKACLVREGISCRVLHAAPQMLRWTTIETYEFLADSWGLNEFLFTNELDPEFDEIQERRLWERARRYASARRHPRYSDPGSICQLFLTVRHSIVPQLLDDLAEAVLSCSPKLVGFTCLFDQTMASAALSKRIRQRSPEVSIVFGGYALEGPPGKLVAAAFPWIDLILVGDGEEAIVDIAREAINRKGSPAEVDNYVPIRRAPRVDLNHSPTPDYSDWFHELDQMSSNYDIKIVPRTLP